MAPTQHGDDNTPLALVLTIFKSMTVSPIPIKCTCSESTRHVLYHTDQNLCQGSSLVIRARSSGMTQKSNTSSLVKQTTSPKPEGCTSAQAVQQGACCATVRLSMGSSTLNILRCVSEDIW